MCVEHRRIQEICLLGADVLPSDIIPLVLVDDAFEGFLVHSCPEKHHIEHLRSGGPEFLPVCGVEGDVGFHRVADVLDQVGRLLGVQVRVILGETASCLKQGLKRVDLVRHRGLQIGVVPSVHEQHADGRKGDQSHYQGEHHRRVDPGLVVVPFPFSRMYAGESEKGKAEIEDQCQEKECDEVIEILSGRSGDDDKVVVGDPVHEVGIFIEPYNPVLRVVDLLLKFSVHNRRVGIVSLVGGKRLVGILGV